MTKKIHIFYAFKDGPWGGGNQFLKSLRKSLQSRGVYTDHLMEADVVLVNSHHFGSKDECQRLLSLKEKRPHVRIIHRLDGPVTLIRNRNEGSDSLIFKFSKHFADAAIVQSAWCLAHCKKLGWDDTIPHTLIFNAPDPDLFYPVSGRALNNKIKLIATSWSPSSGKGFSVYQWMDEHLDWQRFEMTFVGNTPVAFKNIHHLPPQTSQQLAQTLREHDIFITASRNDPCSNSLIEALHCGLPALGYHDGGHPELIQNSGRTFSSVDEIPLLLQDIVDHYKNYQQNIHLPDMSKVCDAYYDFMVSDYLAKCSTPVHQKQFLDEYKKYSRQMNGSKLRHILSKLKKRLVGYFIHQVLHRKIKV